MESIFLSIIIPVYNVEKYIYDCLESIYSQGINDNIFEVIIVNDGTKDESIDVIKDYIENNINCKLVNQKHKGLSIARNTGLNIAKGEYVWFIDSDDWIKQGAINHIIKLAKQKSVDVIASHIEWNYLDNQMNRIDGKHLFDDNSIGSSEYLLNCPLGAIPRFIIKRRLLVENKLYFLPKVLHEDREFGYRLIYYARNIYITSFVYYCYRQRNDGNIMSSLSIDNSLSTLIIYKRAKEFAGKIENRKLSDIIYHQAFVILCAAFPLKEIIKHADIRKLYFKNVPEYRKDAYTIIRSTIPFKKKIKAIICLVSPLLMKAVTR